MDYNGCFIMSDEALMLVLKCIDYEEYGNLYALNKDIPDEEFELAKRYFKHFSPADFKNLMNIEGDPNGWMCTKEEIELVENELGITETMAKREIEKADRRRELSKKAKVKDEAMLKIETLFSASSRPRQNLSTLLTHGIEVYDPGDGFRNDNMFGEGQLFIVTKNSIWYIINNGRPNDNWKLNNIEVEGQHGAIGFKLPYSDELYELVKTVSDDNKYSP